MPTVSQSTASVSKQTIDPAGFFVIRTPLLPFSSLSAWSDCRRLTDSTQSREAFDQSILRLRSCLAEIVSHPPVALALHVASPALSREIDHWLSEPDGKKGRQCERSIVRYFGRMAARPTPFGMFAGCSVGQVLTSGRELASLQLSTLESYRTSYRLDFDYLFSLCQSLRDIPAVRAGAVYSPNSSLRRRGNGWHYVETTDDGDTRRHHLVKIEADPAVNTAIATAHGGASIDELVRAIQDAMSADGVSDAEVMEFVHDSISSGVLVSEIWPQLTGLSALDQLIQAMAPMKDCDKVSEALVRIRHALATLEEQGLAASPCDFQSVVEEVRLLGAPYDEAKLIQVDLFKPVREAILGPAVVGEVTRGIEFLCTISEPIEDVSLTAFRTAFIERFERAWVPLFTVLDEDTGIGFGSSATSVDNGLRRAPQPRGALNELHQYLLTRLIQRGVGCADELVIDAAECPSLSQPGRLPRSFSANFSLAGLDGAMTETSDWRIVLRSLSGPAGSNLLGRFCHTDQGLHEFVRKCLRQEEAADPDAVFAEIVHLPEGRIGNVLARPVLRSAEISYLGRSGAPREAQIGLDDLLVTVTRENDIVLFSERLKKRVVPRLATAHSFSNPTLSVFYRFLCALQHQGIALPAFSWGPLAFVPSLPRVRVGRLVLVVAQWRISEQEQKPLLVADRFDAFQAVQRLRAERRMPRWIVLAQSDNTLPVDLDNPLSVDAFLHVLKRGASAALCRELYPLPDSPTPEHQNGQFAHEIVLPLVSSGGFSQQRGGMLVAPPSRDQERVCLPGGDWIYAKLYGGIGALDEALGSRLPAMVHGLRSSGLLDRWFFVRYSDPEPHIRLRLRRSASADPGQLWAAVCTEFSAWKAAETLWKWQQDTYQREIERYGGTLSMSLVEDLFWADSEAVVAILQGLSGGEQLPSLRFQAAAVGVDRMLIDFGLSISEREELMRRALDSARSASGLTAAGKKALAGRFRSERAGLERALRSGTSAGVSQREWHAVLDRRAVVVKSSALALMSLQDAGHLVVPVESILRSCLHMHVNRSLRNDGRGEETVIYDFLGRIYQGWRMREGQERVP